MLRTLMVIVCLVWGLCLSTSCQRTYNGHELTITLGNGDQAKLIKLTPMEESVGYLSGARITEDMSFEQVNTCLEEAGCYIWRDSTESGGLDITVLGPDNKPFFSGSPDLPRGLYPAEVNLIGSNGIEVMYLGNPIDPVSKGVWQLPAKSEDLVWALIPGSKDGGLLLIFDRRT